MHKRIISILTISVLMISCLVISASAASSVSVSGPSSVQSGNTITYTVGVSNSDGLTGFSANIATDPGVVVTSVSGCPSGWLSTSNNNNIALAGTSTVNRIEVRIKCTVTGNPGESKRVYLSKVNTSDSNGNDAAGSNVSSNAVSIATPLSADCTLSSLVVGNAKLSPAFNASTTSYSCGTVDFAVSKLSVSARAKDSSAKVSVSGTNLAVGENTVSIVVTAPSGAKKTYTIKVTRQQDPNYVPGSNGTLSGITLSAGQLSPAFAEGVKEYVVYVPYETSKISITAAAADPLAKGVENITDKAIEVGRNELTVKCIAENGTETLYKFYVVRMSQFEGLDSVVTPLSAKEKEDAAKAEAAAEAAKQQDTKKESTVSPLLLAIMSVACLVLGIAITAVILRNKYSREMRKALLASEALDNDTDETGFEDSVDISFDDENKFDNYME